MGFFDDLKADNATFISDFSEPVVYTYKNGSTKTIQAIVNRSSEQRLSETTNGLADETTLVISTADIPSINRDGDKVTFPSVAGGTSLVTKTIRNINAQDAGIWLVKVA